MPEGDTLFRTARTLQRALAGRTVTRFETGLAQLAAVDDQSPIPGRTVDEVFARGKHLCVRFSGDLVLRTHLRMHGSWHLYRPGEAWQRPRAQARIVLETKDFVAVGFEVPVAEFHTERDLRHELHALGPDVLGETFDEAEVLRRMRARPAEIVGDALLNQHVVAGIGNVYRSEICFLAGVHPTTPVGRIDDAKVLEMMGIARKLLRANVGEGTPEGITTYRGLRRTTGRSDPGERTWVYGRGGMPCRKCGGRVLRMVIGRDVRSAYVCGVCQPVVG